jgi:hypothetical protein
MLVRFEVDACLPGTSIVSSSLRVPKYPGDIDDLDLNLSLLSISARAASSTPSSQTRHSVRVTRTGQIVSQSSIIELKTRSSRGAENFDWTDTYPQLFLSQTPNMYLAVHDRGIFLSIQKKELGSSAMEAPARAAQPGLRRLVQALREIKRAVSLGGIGGERCSLVYQNGVLRVYAGGEDVLPPTLLNQFKANEDLF